MNLCRSLFPFYYLIFCANVLPPFLGMANSQTLEERKEAIQKVEHAVPSDEALARKAQSMALFKAEGIHVMEGLPVIEDSSVAKKRPVDEVAKRAIAVCIVAVKGEGLDQETIDKLVKKYGAEAFLSPKELVFIKDPHPTDHDRLQFSWRYEDYWVLLWALGYVDKLNQPNVPCDVPAAVNFLKNRTLEQFIHDAKLRDIREILDQADLIYRYDWVVVDARQKGQPTPASLNSDVILERHYVLNWLIGYMDQAWDDISTDT